MAEPSSQHRGLIAGPETALPIMACSWKALKASLSPRALNRWSYSVYTL